MAAPRNVFVRVGGPAHVRALLDPSREITDVLAELAANAKFASDFEGVHAAHCQVQVSTSLEGCDRHMMNGPDTLASLFPGTEPLWIRVILPPPIGELCARVHMLFAEPLTGRFSSRQVLLLFDPLTPL